MIESFLKIAYPLTHVADHSILTPWDDTSALKPKNMHKPIYNLIAFILKWINKNASFQRTNATLERKLKKKISFIS